MQIELTLNSEGGGAMKISIAAARVNAGLTQAELAEKLNINVATLISWEKGKTQPKASQMSEISNITQIPADVLVCVNSSI